MDRLAIPVAFIMVLGLVAVLIGAPLMPRPVIPGKYTLATTLGSVGDTVGSLSAPARPQATSLEEALAAHQGGRRALVPGLAVRWAGAVEVYAPAVAYPATYPELPGIDKAPVAVEAEGPAVVAKPNNGGGGNSSERSVGYGND